MRIKVLLLALVVASCGDDSGARNDADTFMLPDAPEFAPIITSLSASPNPITTPGVPTMVTFKWSYLVEPTYPEPQCTMDSGIGPVMRNVALPVTISQLTVVTLTCSNRQGQSMRQMLLNVPNSAPQLATFTVDTASVSPGTPTGVKFSWTYANVPSPAPICSVDGGTTPITSGSTVSVNLTQARTYRLRCSNGVGAPVFSGPPSAVADVTIAVNECSNPAYYQCDPHATCNDTVDGYTCSCNTNYTPSGTGGINDVCLYTTNLSTDCDTNCPLVGTTCIPKAGYFGSGQMGDCKRAHFTFVTAATYTSTAIGGLAGADAICAAKAATYNTAPYTTGLPGTYVAWMSSSADDAYCRAQTDGATPVSGHLTGKKGAGQPCTLSTLPVAAGPWVRVGDWRQWAPTIDKLLAPNHVTFYPANTNELGAEITSTAEKVWTGTDDNGQGVANSMCADWTSGGTYGVYGEVHGGGQSWTQTSTASLTATANLCSNAYHIRCVEVSSASSPALPTRHRADNMAFTTGQKKAFLTSYFGNGNINVWPDNYGQTGLAAADSVCQARARYAGYTNASTFRAWLDSYPSYITSGRISTTASSYVRPDGVVIGTSRGDLLDGKLQAAFNETELNTYAAGNADVGSVWTGMSSSGATSGTGVYYSSSTFYACNAWSNGTTSYDSTLGRHDLLDGRSMYQVFTTCDQTGHLYCVEDQ